ncbi:PREDICTED: putative olfactory receptor 13C6 [Poecilia mexicana]|uniref:putative olfactory receptor 13C6 n=1 Tax=Poecilia mexicana TaxID=48701 RepID=UPI00072EE1CF|nr:PREDICTED: putative olfactory receptor 13C6 [Poecilia mexicana]
MEDQINITYISLSGYVDLNRYRYFYFFVVLTVYILTVCSNATILYLIWIHKNLHEPMYIFIAALLFNGLLYSTNIYPKLLIDFLSEKPNVSYSACLLQFFLFYSFGFAEFLLLAAMAFDRYVAICKPLRYKRIMRKSHVDIFLVLAWFLPACYLAVQAILSSKIMTMQIFLYHPLFNPFIYGFKMKEINKHLKRLFSSVIQ